MNTRIYWADGSYIEMVPVEGEENKFMPMKNGTEVFSVTAVLQDAMNKGLVK